MRVKAGKLIMIAAWVLYGGLVILTHVLFLMERRK